MSERRTDPDGTTRTSDVAVLGAGSAAESLVAALDGSGLEVVVFEMSRVGGECPFTACMPGKAMLHDAAAGSRWDRAVARRRGVVEDLDDAAHAKEVEAHGALLVREQARIVDARTVEAAGARWRVDHVVLATGSEPIVPPIEGLDADHPRVWTSDDALTADERPGSLVVLGSGVIGTECAFLFSGFGTQVTLVDQDAALMPDAPPRIGALLEEALALRGVTLRLGVEVRSVECSHSGVRVDLGGGDVVRGDRLLVATGRRARTRDLGLDRLGLDPDEPLPVDERGRVGVDGAVWAIGDVAGKGQYTHLANHHAAVVADRITGREDRRFDDVVLAACVFSDPPVCQVGPPHAELVDDPDVVSIGRDLDGFPRQTTDELPGGHLWLAARRSTGTLVAATGIGPRFDELVHALVVAVDGAVPVARLRRSMRPFPTVGEILGPAFEDLHAALTDDPGGD